MERDFKGMIESIYYKCGIKNQQKSRAQFQVSNAFVGKLNVYFFKVH